MGLAALLGACSFSGRSSAIGAGDGGNDGASDAPSADAADAPALCVSWTAQHFKPCAIGSPQPALGLVTSGSPYTYDTTVGGGVLTDHAGNQVLASSETVEQSDGTSVALLDVAAFSIDSGVLLDVIGTKPLLVASWSSITIAGDLDAGSHLLETDATKRLDTIVQHGAGANVGCGMQAGTAGKIAVATGGSGGGGGGALRGSGGGGGQGDSPPGPLGGPGGMKLAAVPTVIRGGCPGGASGTVGPSTGVIAPATSATFSLGGDGGGAIELAAFTSITISGTLRAGGAAGAGAPQGSACGGGGGGSGGYLGLDSPSVTITGVVASNGGGGGGSAPFAGFGNIGSDGEPSETAAAGGAVYTGPNATCGEPGASGGALALGDGTPSTANDACGGGGGGGGVGEILVWSGSVTEEVATLSPAPTLNP